ncbi:MAG: hypothetical protein QM759_13620 [Terricaulis sp.]
MMKYALAALAVLSLAACDNQPPGKGSAPAPGQSGTVALGSTQNLPDWLLIARQRDCEIQNCTGSVYFNQRSITRNADGTADIWIQTDHAIPQDYVEEDAHTVTTLHYTRERQHYRFKCEAEQFTVVERQIMGPRDTVIAHDAYNQPYRNPAPGSLVPVILPVACKGS